MIKYKQDKTNLTVDALPRRYTLLFMLETKMLNYDYMKHLYVEDPHFFILFDLCEKSYHNRYFRCDGYLFKNKILCLSQSFMHELMIREAREKSLF